MNQSERFTDNTTTKTEVNKVYIHPSIIYGSENAGIYTSFYYQGSPLAVVVVLHVVAGCFLFFPVFFCYFELE